MNKLMLFPIGFLLILIIFANVYHGWVYDSGVTEDYSNLSGITINETEGTIDLPKAEPYSFSIWDNSAIILILLTAISVGIVSGAKFWSSGLNDTSQKLLFDGILYGGLWACLSLVASDFLFATWETGLLWMIISIIYIIGMGSHMMQADEG